MNKTELMNKATRTFGHIGLQLRKHSPEIMVVGGIVGTVAASVMACKATTKVNDILGDAREQLDVIHSGSENGYIETPDGEKHEYTSEDGKKDTVIVYTQTAVKMIKLYGPSVILGALSISSILAGHNITRKRNMALAAAYSAIDRSFKDYRKRVIDRFGDETDKELRYNLKAKEIEETVTDSKGKEKKVKKTIKVADSNDILANPFTRCYDDGCNGWTKDAGANKLFLIKQQSWANEKLKNQGHLFLNDVYQMLGFPKTALGGEYGWIYGNDDPNYKGDGFIDFGIFDINIKANRDFIKGYERTLWLNFNVDGPILSYLDNPKYNY